MENRIKNFGEFIYEKKWSDEVTSDVKKSEEPKEGTFTGSAKSIVDELMKKAEGDKGKAMQKLQFYINRAGDKLSNKTEIMKAKSMLKSDD